MGICYLYVNHKQIIDQLKFHFIYLEIVSVYCISERQYKEFAQWDPCTGQALYTPTTSLPLTIGNHHRDLIS